MTITFEVNRPENLTIFTATGEVTFDEMMDIFNRYDEAGPTRYEIYNFTKATGDNFSSEQIEQIIQRGKANKGKTNVSVRPDGGKTALVVARDLDFGLSRVYQAVAQIEGLAWEVEVFRALGEAYQWIGLQAEKGVTN